MEVLAESWRWLRSGAGRTSCLLVGATIAVTVLAMWGGRLVRESNRERETGKLLVAESSTLMFAELAGDEVLRRFTAPTLMPVEAPVGDYQLHIGPPGQLSRTYDVTLAGDNPVVVPAAADKHGLWQLDAEIEGFVGLHQADSAATDIVIADASGLRRLDGTTGQATWTLNGTAQQEALREVAPGFDWSGGQAGNERLRNRPTPLVTLVAAGDLNGDQVADVVVASHRQAWLLAVSGKDGSVLWLAARGALLTAPENIRRRFRGRYEIPSAVIGAPQRAGDLDGDGVADLVATMIDQQQGSSDQPPEPLARWVEAVSGKTGESIWRFDFAEAAFQLPAGADPPASFRWWYDHVSQGARNRGASWSRNRYTRRRAPFSWNGPNHYRPGVPHVLATPDAAGQGQEQVLVIAGQQVVVLDTATGQAGNTIESKQPIGGPLRLADVDGDGIPEMILLSEVPAAPTAKTMQTRMTVHSLQRNKVLWSRTLLIDFPRPDDIGNGLPDWPLFEDLDGDGRCEILLPGAAPLPNNRHACWGNVELLDGETGKARWNRQLFSVDSQFDTFTIGPDIDGDGQREVFAATLWGRMMDLYVDCLSGLDGHTLWRTHRRIRLHDQDPQDFYVGRLSWWNASGDGWPQLIVPVTSEHGFPSRKVTLFSAGTGKITQTGFGITKTHPVDVDGDGWDELLTVSLDPNRGPAKLSCLPGIPANRRHWPQSQLRRTDTQDHWFPAADLDRDGTVDLVRVRPDGRVRAVSGATGALLWKRHERRLKDHYCISLASQSGTDDGELDLNGDQVPDVVISISRSYLSSHPPLLALSGRDGRLLWNDGPDVREVERDMTIVMRDLDGDGRGEVIMVAAVVPRGRRPRGGRAERQTLFVMDGRSGNVRWQQPLQLTPNAWGGPPTASWLNDAIADFNGDGTWDLAVPAEAEAGTARFEVRGYDGAAGRLLWKVLLQTGPQQRGFDSLLPVLSGDANGDGKADLVILDWQNQTGNPGHRVRLVDGSDGSILWNTRRQQSAVGRSNLRGGVLRLLRLRSQATGMRFCLNHAVAPEQLEIIDLLGNWQPTPPVDPRNRRSPGVGLWAVDADADGTDELLMFDRETLRLVAVDNPETPLWERPLKGGHQALERLSRSQDPARGVVVIYDSDAQKLEGINLLDGNTWWTCRLGAQFVQYTTGKQLEVLTHRVAPLWPPQILAHGSTAVLLRQATGVVPNSAERPASRPPPTLTPATSDARMVRHLPWYFDVSVSHRWISPGFAVWAAASCLLLLVLPAAFVARMIRRRQWGLRTLLAAPGVVAVVLVVSRMNVPVWADSQFPNNLTMGMAALPLLTLAYLIGRAVAQRKWRSLRAIFVVFLVVTLGLAGLMLAVDVTQHGQWQAGEYYSLDGWYLIAMPSTYVTGWLSVVIFLAGYFARPKPGHGEGGALRT